jgi:hypothetical protein
MDHSLVVQEMQADHDLRDVGCDQLFEFGL